MVTSQAAVMVLLGAGNHVLLIDGSDIDTVYGEGGTGIP